ncbi:hypothetical protein DIPPA_05638 [Diplonema papillatum]|nr:hypothetical protein DIPPA_05638 [Diplonema papillatum]
MQDLNAETADWWVEQISDQLASLNARVQVWCTEWKCDDAAFNVPHSPRSPALAQNGLVVELSKPVRSHSSTSVHYNQRVIRTSLGTACDVASPRELTTCEHCKELVDGRHGVLLMCGTVDHWHCNTCLEKNVKDMMRLMLRKGFFGIEKARELLPGMVQCSACGHPSLLYVKVTESIADGTRPFKLTFTKQFLLDIGATNELTYHVEVIDQNERRSWAGKFGKENLLKADFRGAWSTEDGKNQPKGRRAIRCPNASYHWIGSWTVGMSKWKDPSGWEYALNWQQTGFLKRWLKSRWVPDPSPTRFVRRRRWQRLRLRLSEDDIILLQMTRRQCPHCALMLETVEEDEF